MKKILFTRFCDHIFYQQDFLKFHLERFDDIYIFCHPTDEGIIRQNVSEFSNIHLCPISRFKHTSNWEEGENCRQIYSFALQLAKKYISTTDVLLYFADDDEFIDLDYTRIKVGINRTVFYEWYLNPSLRGEDVSPLDVLKLVRSNLIKGKIRRLWEIPFFKDNLLLINTENYFQFSEYTTFSGFHRLLKNSLTSLVLSRGLDFLIVHHLKGISRNETRNRVAMKLSQIRNKNDWDFLNCSSQFKRLYEDNSYSDFYDTLFHRNQLDSLLSNLIQRYKEDNSSELLFLKYFNKRS